MQTVLSQHSHWHGCVNIVDAVANWQRERVAGQSLWWPSHSVTHRVRHLRQGQECVYGGAAETDEPVTATVACRGCANQSNSSSQRRQGHRQTRWLQNPVLRQQAPSRSSARSCRVVSGSSNRDVAFFFLPGVKHVVSSVFGAGCWCPFWCSSMHF